MLLDAIGQVYSDMEKSDEALAAYESAAQRDANHPTILAHLGIAYYRVGRNEEALQCLKKALRISREQKDTVLEAEILSDLALVHSETGQWSESLQEREKALALMRDRKNRFGEAVQLDSMGILYGKLGRYQDAFRCHGQALQIHTENHNRLGEALSLDNLGAIYLEIGRVDRAMEFQQKALELFKELGNRREAAVAWGNLGVSLFRLGRYEEALSKFREALAIHQELRNRTLEAATWINIGSGHVHLRQYEEALECYDRALRMGGETGNQAIQSQALQSRALLRIDREQFEEALKDSAKALEIARQTGALSQKARLLGVMGRALVGMNRPEEARERFMEAIGVAESLRASMGGLQLEKMQWNFEFRGLYDNAAIALLKCGKPDEAFNLLERLRSRSLLDMFGQTGAALRDVPKEWLQEKAACVTRYNMLRQEHDRAKAAGAADRAQALDRQLDEVCDRIRDLSHEIELRLKLEERTPLSVKEIQRQLAEGEGLLVYNVLKQGGLLVSLITQSGFVMKEIRLEGLEAELAWFRQAARICHRGYPAREFKKRAHRLYETLLGPVRKDLEGVRTLLVSPDEVLYSVPFEALTVSDAGDGYADLDWLARHTTVGYVYSGTLLAMRRRTPGPPVAGSFVGFGDPDYGSLQDASDRGGEPEAPRDIPDDLAPYLKGAGEAQRGGGWARLQHSGDEVRTCAGMFERPRIFVQADASERTAKTLELNGVRVLHFACHGSAGDKNPLVSALILAADKENDGYLEAREIAELRFPVDLVVLSACDTVSNFAYRGEGLIGLTRAFMIAGARSVIASLWTVSDEGGKEFMIAFYKKLAGGMDKVKALAETKREFMRHEKYSAPYYWAGFVLHGD